MRAFTFAAVALFAFCDPVLAQDPPYDAVVDEDGVYVRSGPGEKYYPTRRMAKGERVRVHRHDPGGWYMISPPAGSYSWVPRQYVRVTGPGTGEVSHEGVVAYVGTDFGKEASVWQRRLTIGQQVEILGESQIEITRERGPEPMVKIRPPRREWRWIPGRAIIRGGAGRPQEPLSPRATGAQTQRRSGTGFLGARPQQRRRAGRRTEVAAARQSSTLDAVRLNTDRKRLRELDDRFRNMILKPTAQWDFARLEADYLELQRTASHPALAGQVTLRMPALARYKRAKGRYDDFIALTSATSERDRELLRMRTGSPVSPPSVGNGIAVPAVGNDDAAAAPIEPPSLPRPAPAPTNLDPEPDTKPPAVPAPVFDPPAGSNPSAGTATPPGMTRVPQRHPRFAGAGIVQRSGEPNVPPYVLLATSGRILAYLEGVGQVDLSRHVGFAMGVEGDRFHSSQMKADLIKVRGLAPIRLRQQ